MTNQIEKLKQDYTDRYVVVDADVPELKRFEGYVGQVKTVNMSGRALVQFEAWSNIGWYDIEPDYLRIVPKPEAAAEKKEAKHAAPAKAPAAPAKAAAAAPAGEKKLSPLEMARMQGAAKPAGEKARPGRQARASSRRRQEIDGRHSGRGPRRQIARRWRRARRGCSGCQAEAEHRGHSGRRSRQASSLGRARSGRNSPRRRGTGRGSRGR